VLELFLGIPTEKKLFVNALQSLRDGEVVRLCCDDSQEESLVAEVTGDFICRMGSAKRPDDGPPRVTAIGFQLSDGNIVGPRDMFADKSFNLARHQANEMADLMRRHGPFEPHRLPLEEMEYTTMPQVMSKLQHRFVRID
jgi:hypothetical protein